MFKRILIRTLVVCLVASAAIAITAFAGYSPGAEIYPATAELRAIPLPHRFRNWAEHDAIIERTWPKPYVLEVPGLVFFGAHHTSDRKDPQLGQIEASWRTFKPTVALCEGRSRGHLIGPVFSRLGGKTEVQLMHELARRDGVRLLSLEPRYEDEVAALLRNWSPERVALYFTMRVYWSEAGGKADGALAKQLLAKRTDVDGLRGSIPDLAALDRIWKRDFPGEADWRVIKEEGKRGFLPAIADDSRVVRGEHMARTLLDLRGRGERVFAVVGSGHVVRLEWILRTALGAPPSADQPLS